MTVRKMVGDDQEVYRVVITTKKQSRNPDYEWRSTDPERQNPYVYSDTETTTEFYGPYNTVGAAKGQLTTQSKDYKGNLRPQILGAEIQKGHIVWERVDD